MRVPITTYHCHHLLSSVCWILAIVIGTNRYFNSLTQWFSTGVLQEFLKHAIPDYLVRGTDLFSFQLSYKNMTTANTTIGIRCKCIKIMYIFCHIGKKLHFCHISKKVYFLVCCRILVISLYVSHEMKTVENRCPSDINWFLKIWFCFFCSCKGIGLT